MSINSFLASDDLSSADNLNTNSLEPIRPDLKVLIIIVTVEFTVFNLTFQTKTI